MNDPRSTRQLTRVGPPSPPPSAPRAQRTRYLVRGTIAPRFIDAHAVEAEDAIAFAPADPREAKAFARMIADGAIRAARPGAYWFDMDTYEAAEARRRIRMLPWLVAVPVVIAAIATLFYRG